MYPFQICIIALCQTFLSIFSIIFADRNLTRIYPPFQAIKLGEKANYTCIADKALQWRWFVNERSITSNPVYKAKLSTTTSTLIIAEVKLNNSGFYKCIGFEGNSLVFEAEGVLSVGGKYS